MIRSSLRLAKMNIQNSRRVPWQGRLTNLHRWPTDGQRVRTTMTISSKTSWIKSTLKPKRRTNLSDKTTADQPNRCLKTNSKAKESKTDQTFGTHQDKWVHCKRKFHKLCLPLSKNHTTKRLEPSLMQPSKSSTLTLGSKAGSLRAPLLMLLLWTWVNKTSNRRSHQGSALHVTERECRMVIRSAG